MLTRRPNHMNTEHRMRSASFSKLNASDSRTCVPQLDVSLVILCYIVEGCLNHPSIVIMK